MSTSLGTDFACATDLDPDLSVVSEGRAAAECSVRRLQSYLWYDPDYGYPLVQHINAPRMPIGLLAQRAQTELLKDERCESVTLEAAQEDTLLEVTGRIQTGEGPFDFTLNLSGLTAQVILNGS